MDQSGGQAGDSDLPKAPKTAMARITTKIGFDELDHQKSQEEIKKEYMIKRDPMQEFFTLTC